MNFKRTYKSHSKIQTYLNILFLFTIFTSQISSEFLPSKLILNKNNYKKESLTNKTNYFSIHKKKSKTWKNLYSLKRMLENNNTNNSEINDDKLTPSNSTKSSSKDLEKDPGVYLIAWFVIFFMMGLYIIFKMKKEKKSKVDIDQVWKFLFFANNGAFIAAIINCINIRNMVTDFIPFVISGICFIIGCIYYFIKFCKDCNKKVAEKYFSKDKLIEWFKLPCIIWELLYLSDGCCRCDSYTVTKYEDGHTDSTYCCVMIWNYLIKFIKILAFFFTVISYYIFIFFLLLFWLLAKLIYYLKYEGNKKSQQEDNNVQKNTTIVDLGNGNKDCISEINKNNNNNIPTSKENPNINNLENANNIINITYNTNLNSFQGNKLPKKEEIVQNNNNDSTYNSNKNPNSKIQNISDNNEVSSNK